MSNLIAINTFIDKTDCTCILYPKTLQVNTILASILCMKSFEGSNILLMLTDSEGLSNCVGVNLPKEIFISYTNLTNSTNVTTVSNEIIKFMKDVLQYPCYIFIDNITLFRQCDLGLLFTEKSNETKIICFGMLTTPEMDILYLKKHFSKFETRYFTLENTGPKIDYSIFKEKDDDDNKVLQSFICLNSNSKHVIYANKLFNKLVNIFSTLELPVFVIKQDTSYENMKDIIKKFNQLDVNQACVLLTSKVLLDDIYNIKYVHLVESLTLSTYETLISKIHKRKFYSYSNSLSNISIIFYFSSNDSYKHISLQIRNEIDTEKTRILSLKRIYMSPKLGLCLNI